MRQPLTAFTLAIGLVAGLCLPPLSGWAGKSIPAAEPDSSLPSLKLSDLNSFDVFDMPTHDFAASREDVPQELVEYARTAIQQDERLHYNSPAQGVLHLHCANMSCARIRAEVTYGENGPVVWQTEMQYRLNPLVDFTFMPDGKKFANKLVNKLAEDYQQTVKAATSPQKIQIKEE